MFNLYFSILGNLIDIGKPVHPITLFTPQTELYSSAPLIWSRINEYAITGISERECAARCLINCDNDKGTDNRECQYYYYYKRLCYIGSFKVNDNEDIDLGDADDAAVEFPCAKAMIKNTTPALGSILIKSNYIFIVIL